MKQFLIPYFVLLISALLVSFTDGQDLRLPRTILPRLYEITLLPILIEGNFTTEGSTTILMDCVTYTNTITLHIADIQFNPTGISVTDVGTNQMMTISSIREDKSREFLIISTNAGLVAGRQYRLTMTFLSILNDELRGFYRSSYTEKGTVKYMAVSQMQPTDARRAFPCFDEPNMKANFSIKLGRKETQVATSNMPLKQTTPIADRPGYVWDLFETSLPVSTYLVGMMVSEFTYIESPSNPGNTLFRIWARPDAISQAEYASVIGPQVLKFYEDYFQIPFPLPKQDMLALTDLSFGGMENWGMITYRETALLYDEKQSAESDKQRVASVVAHELAHQWFGDLVTLDWWSDLWLNEGFASYMEYLGTNSVEPGFDILPQIVIDDIQDVFGVDALETSHPISVTVNDPNEINELFDRISYGKGASIIRMLNKFLGDNTFRLGLTNYLNSKKYGNAVQNDLWTALTAQAAADNLNLPVDVGTLMDTWTSKMGFPLITVIRDYNSQTADVSQERFLLIASANSTDQTVYSWWVPLTFSKNFSEPYQSTWLAYGQSTTRIGNVATRDQWVIFNVDEQGYYRVNYDATNWGMIVTQLLADYQKIGLINRAQLLDDSFNVARVNKLSYSTPLSLALYLVNEKDYIPWVSATNGLGYIDLMFVRTSGYGDFKHYMAKLLTPLYNYVTFNQDPNDAHLLIYTRVLAVQWACKLSIGDCVTNSVQLFQQWMQNPLNSTIVNANQKRSVTCTAVAAGSEIEWNFAFQRYLETNVAAEASKMLYGMSCSTEAWILSRFLDWALDPTSGIRRGDASTVFRNVASNSVTGRYIAWDFVRNRWSDMVAYFPTLYDLARIVDSISAGFNTPLEVNELKQFATEHADELGTASRAVTQSIERAEANVQWMSLHFQEIVIWLQQNP